MLLTFCQEVRFASGIAKISRALSISMEQQEAGFDVALSFAGQDRNYVRLIAAALKSSGIRVFFDEFYRGTLWGRDLTEELSRVYFNKSSTCVAFISDSYNKGKWTTFERRNIIARFLDDGKYLLPISINNARMLGLPPTIAHLDADIENPMRIARQIITKLKFLNVVDHSRIDYSKCPIILAHASSAPTEKSATDLPDGFFKNKKSKIIHKFSHGSNLARNSSLNPRNFVRINDGSQVLYGIGREQSDESSEVKVRCKIPQVAIGQSSLFFEESACESIVQLKIELAVNLLEAGIYRELRRHKKIRKPPSLRLIDLYSGLLVRYGMDRRRIQRMVSEVEVGNLGAKIMERLEKVDFPTSQWYFKWSNVHAPMRWGWSDTTGQVKTLVF